MSPISEKLLKLDSLSSDDGSPVFSASRSAVQAVAAPERAKQAESEAQGPVFRESTHEPQGIVHRFKNMVTKENMVSTVMTLGFIKGWLDKTLGAWGLPAPAAIAGKPGLLGNVPGVKAVDSVLYGKGIDKSKLTFSGNPKPQGVLPKIMAISITSGLVQNLAFFMTKRGGEFPEGKNMLEKTINSIKHPDKHAVHFSTASISGILAVMSGSRMLMGLQGMNKMRQGDASQDMKTNASMVISGIAGLICTPMIFLGMFKIKNEGKDGAASPDKPEEEAKSPEALKTFAEEKAAVGETKGSFIKSFSPKHLKDMAAYAMKHDRMGVVGRGLALVMELGFVAEGRMALQKDPTNGAAYKTVQGGLTGVALSLLQSHFVYDRLLTASQSQGASASR